MKNSEISGKLDKFLKHLSKTVLLIIDGFGFKKLAQKQAEYFYCDEVFRIENIKI